MATKKGARQRPEGHSREREYQHLVKQGLDRMYGEVRVQWQPFVGEGMHIYRPVVDIAVGPFATRERHGDRYTQLMNDTRPFIERLVESHNRNVETLYEPTSFDLLVRFNENARCLFCIEIEETGHRKHCLGNLVNASALGRVGILVARNDDVLHTFVRQRTYFQFFAEVEKNTFRTANALILTEDQLQYCLSRGNGI
jgi:hypothetical protein